MWWRVFEKNHVTEIEAVVRTLRRHERCLMCDERPGFDGPFGEPAHQRRRVRRQEVIARRGEIDVPEIWRIQPYPADTSDNGWREIIEQRDLIDRVLDQDPCGVELLANVGLAFEDDDAHPGPRQGGGARQTCETGAYDDAITLRRRSRGHAAGRKYSTMPAPTDTSTKPAYISGLMPALGG